jgi:hypothetical protein
MATGAGLARKLVPRSYGVAQRPPTQVSPTPQARLQLPQCSLLHERSTVPASPQSASRLVHTMRSPEGDKRSNASGASSPPVETPSAHPEATEHPLCEAESASNFVGLARHRVTARRSRWHAERIHGSLRPPGRRHPAHDPLAVLASVAVVASASDPNARQGGASSLRIQGIFVNFGDGSRAGRQELRDA